MFKIPHNIYLRSDSLKLVRRLDFIKLGALSDELILEPGEVFNQSCTVPNVACPHSVQFGLVLDRLSIGNGAANFIDLLVAAKTLNKRP